MARAIAAWEADVRGLDLDVDSAGTLGIVDAPADPKAAQVAMEIGLDLVAHRSKGVTPELIAWADRILVMEDEHLAFVGTLAPDAIDRVVPLGRVIGVGGITDPHGSWFLRPYRRCRDDLRAAVGRLLTGPAGRPVPT